MRRLLLVAAALAVSTGTASATESTIVPNVGIRGVKIGMSLAQVKKVLGPPATANARAQVSGHVYIEYGWDFSTFWVGFLNTKGRLHAALIGTDIAGQKTKDGVGIGTAIARLRARYNVACNTFPNGAIDHNVWYRDPGENVPNYCILGTVRAPTTVFGLRCTAQPPLSACTDWAVDRVVVRAGVLRDE